MQIRISSVAHSSGLNDTQQKGEKYVYHQSALQSRDNRSGKYLLEHVQYLETQYASGYFLASGRKVPRTGGVILAQFSSEEEAWQIIRQDPFYIHQIADYQLTQFVPSKTAPSLAFLQES